MTIAQERVGMPLDEFLDTFSIELGYDLIDGKEFAFMPTTAGHAVALDRLFSALMRHEETVEFERAYTTYTRMTFFFADPDDANWVTKSYTPDVSIIQTSRFEAYIAATPHWLDIPVALVPDIVIEVSDVTDLYTQFNRRIQVYLQDGVKLVVALNPHLRTVVVYRQGEQPLYLNEDDTLDISDVIPDFKMSLSSLFSKKITR